jgi:hypothetical protein
MQPEITVMKSTHIAAAYVRFCGANSGHHLVMRLIS